MSAPYRLGGCTTLKQSDNASLWTGECDACMNLMYAVEGYREEYAADKKNLHASRPPMLTKVTWAFRHLTKSGGVEDTESDGEWSESEE